MAKRNNDEFMATARRRFAEAAEQEAQIRQEARFDVRFATGDQWDAATKAERELAKRPALIFNRLPTFVSQVSNEARQNKPSIRFAPVDDNADKDTAKVYEGLARHIQYASKADIAYETAIEHSAMGGFGYFRLLTDYEADSSFEQEVRFAPVVDPFAVYGVVIPRCFRRAPRWAFVVEDLTKEEFEAQYPDSELVSVGFEDGAARAPGWVTSESVRIAEYWWIDAKPRTLQLLSTGEVVYRDQYEELPPGIAVEKSRQVQVDTVHFAKLNGVEVLPGTETVWAGSVIPIFAVLGRQVITDGRPELFSLVRFMRDPQRLVNFYKSGIAEQIGLASRAPWVGAEGQFEGYEEQWRTANTRNHAYLSYRPVALHGQPVAPPQRQSFEPPIAALSAAAAQEVDDLKAIAGIFDASLGAQGNETSGIAITRRQQQSGLTNLHFIDNLHRAQEEAGKELAAVIPRVYDTERQVRIIGEDEEERVVRVNAQYVDERGKEHHYNLSAGKYDVTVSSGPSYTTKRQEAFEMLTKFAQSYPQLLQIGGDIIFRNSDTPGADELAERLKRQLPPELLADDDGAGAIPPQVQAQLAQLTQMNQQLTQALNEASKTLETRKLDIESRERIEAMRNQAQLIMTEAKLGSAEGIAMLRAEIQTIGERLALLNIGEPVVEDEPPPEPQGIPGPEMPMPGGEMPLAA